MIKNILINGFPLQNEGISYIMSVQGLTAPTIDMDTFNRGGRDGIILGNPYYRQRVFTVTLAILADTPAHLLEQKDRLISNLRLQQYADSRYKEVVFETSDGLTRSCQAITTKLDGQLDSETSYAYTPLTIQMTANRWYFDGAEHTLEISAPNYGGMAVPTPVPMSMANNPAANTDSQIINAGNTESLPTFRITGPLTGFDLYNSTTQQHMTMTYTISEGEYFDLDTYSHSAVANSVTNIRGSVSGDWIVLVPGANELGFNAAGSTTATAEITYKDAYLGI